MAKPTKAKSKSKKGVGFQGERDESGRFLPGSGPKVKTKKERRAELEEYDSISEKAISILEEELSNPNRKERIEAARLLAKLNPQDKPKDVLDVRAREIVEYWVRGNVVVVDVE